MEGSIEMKMQAIDKMIEIRNQLIVMQKKLNIWNEFDEDDEILVYDTPEFFDIARHIGAKVESDGTYSSGLHVLFTYKDVKFSTYVNSSELSIYEHEIHRSDENVL